MKVLFCEGSSLSARESLTALGMAFGREVEVLVCDPNPLCICRFSSFRTRYFRSPSVNEDLEGYWDFLLDLVGREKVDVLLPVHEQALLFSRRLPELSRLVGIALPSFDSYLTLFSKVRFMHFLDGAGLHHPRTVYCSTTDEVRKAAFFPAFLKLDFGTASQGVWRLDSPSDLDAALAGIHEDGNSFLIQEPAPGVFEIVYSLFDHGRLVAVHACRRLVEGACGSSSSKIGVDRPGVVRDLERIGTTLSWHGPLAIDYFWDEAAGVARYIDASPRLVEPMNAVINGINMPAELVRLSMGEPAPAALAPTAGKKSHMVTMSLLRLGDRGAGKRRLLAELSDERHHRGAYAESSEELLPVRIDRQSGIPRLVVLAKLFTGASSKEISGSTVRNYALSWDTIRRIIGRPGRS